MNAADVLVGIFGFKRVQDPDWIIEYEMPPLRAIYRTELPGGMTEDEVRTSFCRGYPKARIRSITRSKILPSR